MIIDAFIQNRKKSNLRSKFDEKTLKFVKEVELLASASYQYGFIPGTLGEDGDCIDIWLISETNFEIGSQVSCRILGMLELFEEDEVEKQKDNKIIVCPEDEESILTDTIIEEIKSFTFEIFKKFPEVTITFGEFLPADKAEEFILLKS